MRVQTSNSRAIPADAKNGIALPILRVDNRDYNLEEMARPELMELAALIKADIDNIEFQLSSDHTGAWANPGWEERALYAKKMKSRQVDLIQAELGRRKERAPTLAKIFMDLAFSLLPEELFRSVMEGAKAQHKEALAGV